MECYERLSEKTMTKHAIGNSPGIVSSVPRHTSVVVQVFGRRNAKTMRALGDRRLKSAKARNRGKWGTDGATGSMGTWPRGVERRGWSEDARRI
jgi:hypothetical protein